MAWTFDKRRGQELHFILPKLGATQRSPRPNIRCKSKQPVPGQQWTVTRHRGPHNCKVFGWDMETEANGSLAHEFRSMCEGACVCADAANLLLLSLMVANVCVCGVGMRTRCATNMPLSTHTHTHTHLHSRTHKHTNTHHTHTHTGTGAWHTYWHDGYLNSWW